MNRVYNVSHKDEGVHYAVGAESRNKAIMAFINETSGDTWEYINHRASLVKGYNGKPIYTENSGLLDIEELLPKGFKAWWDCPECGEYTYSEHPFDYVPIDKYKCKRCGYIGDIPFAD